MFSRSVLISQGINEKKPEDVQNDWEIVDMKKRLLLNFCILIIALSIAAGCLSPISEEEKKAMDDVEIVCQYFTKLPDGSIVFSAGPYQGGTAIIGAQAEAFWVKEGKGYRVNQAAKDVAPALEQAPDTVKYDVAFIEAAHCDQNKRGHDLPLTSPHRLASVMQKLDHAKTQEERFYALNKAAKESFVLGKIEDARKFANELMSLLPQFKSNWNYGNAVQDANLVLGRIAASEGRIDEAKQYLLEAGKSTGSPQMNSFGPNMSLAKDLLEKGERQVVLDYFELCQKFWQMDRGTLDMWSQQVNAGEIPNFGANLVY